MTASYIQSLARKTILELKPYSSAREEFTGSEGIFLDANESPFNSPWNRYPDPFQQKVRERISQLNGVPVQSMILGNGSDETIDMLFRTFCEPGKDNVISVSPTYGMYNVSAGINGVEYKTVLLNQDFSLPVSELLAATDQNSKLLFLCSPNNPTANVFYHESVKQVITNFKGLVVIDEAYADFSPGNSWVPQLEKFKNLVVLQTLSKAWGLASIRLGMAFAHEEVIRLMMKVKPPYNVNALTQQKALEALSKPELKDKNVTMILSERDLLMEKLSGLQQVEKVFPSDANFFLVKVGDPDSMYEYLVKHGIIVRNRSREPLCQGCLRLTVGSPGQNQFLFDAISKFDGSIEVKSLTGNNNPGWINVADTLGAKERKGNRERKTKETTINVEIQLDGSGEAYIETGLGFFDHMLDQIARHSGCNLSIKVKGDLDVDEHHTIEDTGIALGESFGEALGDKKGIGRYGFALPMDDCAALVLLDFGGRPELVWKAKFKREKVGDLPTEMFSHFFKSFAVGAKCNLYIKAKGENEHHKIEAIFKALARAIKMAVRKELFSHQLPSTKGLL
jgi:histidinol-phosphate aminotransferase